MKWFFFKKKAKAVAHQPASVTKKAKKTKQKNLSKEALAKQSYQTTFKRISALGKSFDKYDEQYLNELKSVLIKADVSPSMTLNIIKTVKNKIKASPDHPETVKTVQEALIKIYGSSDNISYHLEPNKRHVILMVGVNGVGKTTSLAKLANYYQANHHKPLIIAADTFRAAAIPQLEIWAKRIGCAIVKPFKVKQDPASVVYTGLEQAQQNNCDVVLIDTAGRLHNKVNLMHEITKINQTIDKIAPKAIKETILVIDGNMGQNSLNQVKEFSSFLPLSALFLTKVDGTPKGGIIFSIKKDYNLAVKWVGVGEKLENLVLFKITNYVENFFN